MIDKGKVEAYRTKLKVSFKYEGQGLTGRPIVATDLATREPPIASRSGRGGRPSRPRASRCRRFSEADQREPGRARTRCRKSCAISTAAGTTPDDRRRCTPGSSTPRGRRSMMSGPPSRTRSGGLRRMVLAPPSVRDGDRRSSASGSAARPGGGACAYRGRVGRWSPRDSRSQALARIVATTMAVNRGSRRVMEKAGLTHVGNDHRCWPDPLPGSDLGDVEYEIARDAWQAVTQ